MIKEITRKEFMKKYPDNMIYDLGCQDAIYLENGVILLNPEEWNGEVYRVKDEDGKETIYRPVYEPIDWDENGEVTQEDIIGFDEY